MKKNIQLPNKPSKLIELALRDLISVENTKGYKVDMDKLHRPNGHCKVCLAGSILAKTFKVEKNKDIWMFEDLQNEEICNDTDYKKLNSLDEYRSGAFDMAEDEIDINTDLRFADNENFYEYREDKTLFKMQLQAIAEFYKSIGL